MADDLNPVSPTAPIPIDPRRPGRRREKEEGGKPGGKKTPDRQELPAEDRKGPPHIDEYA
jgi:hypothetical protein